MAPAAPFIAVLASANLYSHINVGIRHDLILYPFVAIGGVHGLTCNWRATCRLEMRDRAGVGRAPVLRLVGWSVSRLATANPDYLRYFNEAVANPERALLDCDLAWGRQLRRSEHRLADLKVKTFSFLDPGTADLTPETFPKLTRLPPDQPTTWWIAITALARGHGGTRYSWLDTCAPIEVVGKSIHLRFAPEAP